MAHKYGYAHRDISPYNIFIKNGYLKIGDFGNSKQLVEDNYSNNTLVGNFPYFSPILTVHYRGEYQKSNSNPLLDDVWSLGVIFFELSLGSFVTYRLHNRSREVLYQEEIDRIIDRDLKKFSNSFRKLIKSMLTYEEDLRISSKQAYRKAKKIYIKATEKNR